MFLECLVGVTFRLSLRAQFEILTRGALEIFVYNA